jgi:hypothetical protein
VQKAQRGTEAQRRRERRRGRKSSKGAKGAEGAEGTEGAVLWKEEHAHAAALQMKVPVIQCDGR